MFRLSSTFVPTVSTNFSTELNLCFDCARPKHSTELDLCFDCARPVFRLYSTSVSTESKLRSRQSKNFELFD